MDAPFGLCIYTMDDNMTREKLVKIIQELLKTDHNLDFLAALKKEHLETLVACIRDRVDRLGK